ncbi:MAG: ferritin [Helicobacteraceae bacterium]|jgi:ferritin-like protein|nr:ferritin [Helicobacteraceae bacterium]
MANAYQEENLPNEVKDFHRVLSSAIEELEAVDWYHQRAATTSDGEAKSIFEHNRDEEIEHFAMNVEWLRRNNKAFDEALRGFLFSEGAIVGAEAAFTGGDISGESESSGGGSLGVGSLK